MEYINIWVSQTAYCNSRSDHRDYFFTLNIVCIFFMLTDCKDLSREREVQSLQSKREPWMMLVQFLLCC